MTFSRILFGLIWLTAIGLPSHSEALAEEPAVLAEFESNDDFAFSNEERSRIRDILETTHSRVAEIFPELASTVRVTVIPVERPALDPLGGVTGRADRPDELLIEISQTYPDGVLAAADGYLAETFIHELHHTVRGWTMNGNHFGHGIAIAAINEGLATVFAEEVSGKTNPTDLPPPEVEAWADEILGLPRAANYGEWMFQHPDGREAIGYRTGRWVVRRAMTRSGLDIIALTDMTPAAIWELAGFDWDRQLR
jgi:hypothetical protein